MTRLREALERANAAGSTSPTAIRRADSVDDGVSSPDAWQLDTFPVATATATPAPAIAPVPAAVAPARSAEPAVTSKADPAPAPANPDPAPADLIPLAVRLVGTEKLVVLPNADVTLVEQFRRLAAALHHAQTQRGARTVMIASALENEGKTLTATNLALTLSESYQRRVLLIDADLRRPSVHSLFGIDNEYGLSDTLKHVTPDGKLPIHRVSPNLWVVPGGRPDPDPMSGLVSDTMQQLLSEAVEQFDWVVIDTPPVVLLPDANLLAAMIDTALLVVRANRTPYPLSAKAVEAIGPDRILGVVLNRAQDTDLADGGYYYSKYRYSYGHHKERNSKGWRKWLARRRSGR